MTTSYWLLLVLGVMMSAGGGIFLKIGSAEIQFEGGITGALIQIALNWKILSGMLMYFIPVLIWIFMLKKIDLSFLQPLFSSMYVVTPILAIFFLNEQVPTARWLGIGVVAIGVLIIAKT
jgi:drug/metabolite transporter (DMT)-like permease